MKKLYYIILLLTPLSSISQQLGFEQTTNIITTNGSDTLKYAWAGGMDAIQVSKFDFNLDGTDDLFVFDRSGDALLPFIWKNGNYIYKPKYVDELPTLQHWAIPRDYNGDGKIDIFAYVNGGIGVWKNISTASQLQFEQQFFIADNVPGYVEHITTLHYTNTNNLYVSSQDIPSISDIDGDGDLDVLTFSNAGIQLTYHKNFSVEQGYGLDSLIFQMKNACWGHFKETGTISNTCVLFDTCDINVSTPEKSQTRHIGSTILALDLDNNGMQDILLGDVSFNNAVALYNDNGTPNSNTSMVSQDIEFPAYDTPIDIPLFPAFFFEDIDGDGIKDLIASPNTNDLTINLESVWHYKNNGTNTSPLFNLQSKSWFQDEMIDLGSSAYPILVDFNNDGLQDLVVSSFGIYDTSAILDRKAKIQLFENTGSNSLPELNLIEEDLNNFSSSSYESSLYPTFYDMDNDNDLDMILGQYDGPLLYFENSSGSLSAFNFPSTGQNLLDDTGSPIDIGYRATPQLFDLDQDGDADLLIGHQTGILYYYENMLDASGYLFRFRSDTLGGIDMSPSWSNEGNSVPCAFRNQSGITELLVGTKWGYFSHFNDIDGNILGTYNQIDSIVAGINLGEDVAPALGYLNADTLPDLIIGNIRGGLTYYIGSDSIYDHISETHLTPVMVYPNPVEHTLHIKGDDKPMFEFRVYNQLGQLIMNGKPNQAINVEKLKSGIYFLTIDQRIPTKFIKR